VRYRKLGLTDVDIPLVALGTWALGDPKIWGPQDEADSVAAIHASLDMGATLIVTAEGYGHGYSEQVVGRALRDRRGEAIICTKASPEHHYYKELISACERSLQRLHTDFIDIYMLHWPNHNFSFDEPARALQKLKEQGKIGHIAVSNFGARDLLAMQGCSRIEADELPYSLLWRAIEYEIASECVRNAVSILCYSPLQQGLLTGRYSSPDDVPPGQARTAHFCGNRPLVPHAGLGAEQETFATIAAVREIASSTGYSMPQIALAWLLKRAGVMSVIVGARNAREAISNAEAATLSISASLIESLSSVTADLKHRFGFENPDPWQLAGRMR
jgi:aryl-alcohol dehydrogenase-like predicted oxidoreductase